MIDNNPALPPVSSIIHKHKHLLERDGKLKETIPPGSVFVSYRKNKNIRDMLIHNQFRPSNFHPTQTVDSDNLSSQVGLEVETNGEEGLPGCVPCGRCYVCKLGYLTPCDSFTSYHTTQVISISKHVTCQDKEIIYLADCITCESNTVG